VVRLVCAFPDVGPTANRMLWNPLSCAGLLQVCNPVGTWEAKSRLTGREATQAVQGSGTDGREGATAVYSWNLLALLPAAGPGHLRSRSMAESAGKRPPASPPASAGTHPLRALLCLVSLRSCLRGCCCRIIVPCFFCSYASIAGFAHVPARVL
jgi:hypothetical protein